MASRSEKWSPDVVPDGTDSEDDLRLLLECLHFQRGSPSSQRQAITTIATMCSSSASSRDLLRTSGGLSYILNMMTTTNSHDIQQAALYTLACATEKNVVNQRKLCDNHIFPILCDILKCPETPAFVHTTAAYLAGCLMSGNSHGQNMAREKRVVNRLIVLFKSHLPSFDPSHGEGAAAQTSSDTRLWASVCSALTTATNNPQNESNQSLCSQVFPAALSLLQSSCLTRADVVRPAVNLLTSCVASNGTTQDRLRMVGGLRNLTNAMRELVTPHNLTPSHTTDVAELPIHIVKTISAAGFGHATNCDHLCSLGAVPLLLVLLGREDGELDGQDKLNIVMCLSMLTETNTSAQRQVIEYGGLHLLVRNMAESKEEELCKAATFVMQCCLHKNSPSGEPASGATGLSADIARLDNMLRSKPSCEDTDSNSGLNPEVLHMLDSKKLPVNDRVSKWLETAKNSPDCSNEASPDEPAGGNLDLLQKLQVLQSLGGTDNPLLQLSSLLGAGGLSQLGSLIGPDPMRLQLQNLKTAYLAARANTASGHEVGAGGQGDGMRNETNSKTSKNAAKVVSGGKGVEVKGHLVKPQPDQQSESLYVKRKNTTGRGLGKKSTRQQSNDCVWVSSVEKPTSRHPARAAISHELEKERALREELEVELAREKSKRKELEKQRSQTVVLVQEKEQPLNKGSGHQEGGQLSEERGHQEKGQNCEGRGACRKQGDPLYKDNRKGAGQTNKQTNSQHNMAKKEGQSYQRNTSGASSINALHDTNKTPISVRPNIRYAASSSVFRAPKLPTRQMVSKMPQTCGNPLKLSSHVAKQQEQSHHHNISLPGNAHRHNRISLPGNVSYTSVIGGIGQHSAVSQSSSCEHECLGCRPRLKCPLVTSRNFTKLLQADRSTCAYHRRMVNMLRHADTHPASLVKTSMIPHEASDHHKDTDTTVNYINTPDYNIQTSNDYYPTTPVQQYHTTEQHELGYSTEEDIYSEAVLQAGLHDSSRLSQPPSQLTNSMRYYKYTDVTRPSHHTHSRDTVPQEHHQSQVHLPQAHHQSQVHLPQAHHQSQVHLPQAHHQSQVHLPQAHHQSQVHLPQAHHQSQVHLPQVHHQTQAMRVPQAMTSSKSRPAVRGLTDITNGGNPLSVYDYHTPAKVPNKYLPSTDEPAPQRSTTTTRRRPVRFTKQEEQYLVEGVKRLGKRWRHILTAYQFHPSRTAVDLKDKFRLLSNTKGVA